MVQSIAQSRDFAHDFVPEDERDRFLAASENRVQIGAANGAHSYLAQRGARLDLTGQIEGFERHWFARLREHGGARFHERSA